MDPSFLSINKASGNGHAQTKSGFKLFLPHQFPPNGITSYLPLKERLAGREVRILSMGEVFGGTQAFCRIAFIGICEFLKKQREAGEGIDLLVINGAILPEVPARGSRGNQQKMRFLMDGIEGISDSAEVMREAVKPLVKAAGGASIAYVFGEEDYENIQIISDRLMSELTKSQAIQNRMEAMSGGIGADRSRISSIDSEIGSLERQADKIRGKIGAGKGKKGEHEEALRELEQEIKRKAKKKSELSERMGRKAAEVALLQDDLANLQAVKRTKIAHISPSEAKDIRQRAENEYRSLLLRLFAGADLLLVDKNMSMLQVKGMNIAVGHNMENSSKASKKGGLGSVKENFARMQFSKQMPTDTDLLIFSHHPATKCWAIPNTYADKHPLYLLQQGSLADPLALQMASNSKIKIPQTEAFNKYPYESGITIITAGKDGAMRFSLLGISHLEQHARAVLEREKEAISKRKSSKGKNKPGEEEAEETDARLKAETLLRLPSKMSDEKFGIFIKAAGGMEKAFAHFNIPPKRKIIPVHADVISDTHIGLGSPFDDYSPEELMEAAIRDIRAHGLPHIMVLAGDMVEGVLGSKANEWNPRNFVDRGEFERKLSEVAQERNLSDKQKLRALVEFGKRQEYGNTVSNIDEQFRKLKPLLALAAEVVDSGGDNILISGNHPNQTNRNEVIDEATRLANEISSIGGFGPNHPKIHIFYGGWIGSGEVTVRGIPFFGIHSGKSSADKVAGFMDHSISQRRLTSLVSIAGHEHDSAFAKHFGHIVYKAPSTAPQIPYVDQSAQHGGLQGYGRLTLFADQNGVPFESIEVENRYKPQLERHIVQKIDPLYLEVFNMMVKKRRS